MFFVDLSVTCLVLGVVSLTALFHALQISSDPGNVFLWLQTSEFADGAEIRLFAVLLSYGLMVFRLYIQSGVPIY